MKQNKKLSTTLPIRRQKLHSPKDKDNLLLELFFSKSVKILEKIAGEIKRENQTNNNNLDCNHGKSLQ
jgi:hypothetical protein